MSTVGASYANGDLAPGRGTVAKRKDRTDGNTGTHPTTSRPSCYLNISRCWEVVCEAPCPPAAHIQPTMIVLCRRN